MSDETWQEALDTTGLSLETIAHVSVWRYADTLIEIAAAFETNWYGVAVGCGHCSRMFSSGCHKRCPGLLARRALGVA